MEKYKTPAQDYAQRVVLALDEVIANPDSLEWYDEAVMLLMERPRTLRAALAAYLYRCRMKQLATV